MPKSQIRLALSVSGRSVGAAWADKLGLIGFDLITLYDHKTPESAAIAFRSWLDKLLALVKPSQLVLEDIDHRRVSAKTNALHAVVSHLVRKPPASYKRKPALMAAAKAEGLDPNMRCLKLTRQLAIEFSRQCPELRFHRVPRSRLRSGWDRNWGQAIVAGTLALYSKHETI